MASDRDTQIERIAAIVHDIPDWEDGCVGKYDQRRHAAALYDAGLRAEPDAGALRAARDFLAVWDAQITALLRRKAEVPEPPMEIGVIADAVMVLRAALASDTGGSSTAGDEP